MSILYMLLMSEYLLILLKLFVLSINHTLMHILTHASAPLPSARQHQSYCDCLEVKREYYQNSSVLDCVTQC